MKFNFILLSTCLLSNMAIAAEQYKAPPGPYISKTVADKLMKSEPKPVFKKQVSTIEPSTFIYPALADKQSVKPKPIVTPLKKRHSLIEPVKKTDTAIYPAQKKHKVLNTFLEPETPATAAESNEMEDNFWNVEPDFLQDEKATNSKTQYQEYPPL